VSVEPVGPTPALEEEDRARADLYALLARLYYQGPDAGLLALIARDGSQVPPETGSPFTVAWQSLAAAIAGAEPAAVQQEYDDLFVGTGRAEVSLYAAYYLAETGREKILVRLRTLLGEMGLSRKQSAGEPEDHIAGLFDVMRHLVEAGSSDAALQDQRRFFSQFVEPFYGKFCAAVDSSERAEFYSRVAALTRAFLDVEKEASKMI
jgi:TorA maturation chaperone TorD